MKNKIIEDLDRRYAAKAYDPDKKLTSEQLGVLIDAARLSPSSYGLQPYEVFVVLDPAVREKLFAASMEQKPVRDASALFVLAYYTEFPKGFVEAYIKNTAVTRGVSEESLAPRKKIIEANIASMTPEGIAAWNRNQVYILLGTLLSAAARLEIDATPIEGFEPGKYDEILGLKGKGLRSAVLMAAGFHSADDWNFGQKKVRRPVDQTVKIIR